MKRMFIFFIAVFFPWIILLMDNNPGGALVALIMQATIIGWFPATLWALRLVREKAKVERVIRAEKVIHKAQKKAEKEKTKQ